MGSLAGSAVTAGRQERGSALLPGYERLDGVVPVFHPPGMEERAEETRHLLEAGSKVLSEVLDTGTPELEALLVARADWGEAPREGERPYPSSLPYLAGTVRPPSLVLPEALSAAFRPRTEATWPLVVWHELAHAFLLQGPVPRAPAWLREFLPQALSTAVARRSRLPLGEHLSQAEQSPGFTVRGFASPAGAGRQMEFQNLLLRLGTAALEEFGEGFLRRLAHAMWATKTIVGRERAEDLLADALGPGGREWLERRPEF